MGKTWCISFSLGTGGMSLCFVGHDLVVRDFVYSFSSFS
jgi:hypothetical protein